MKGWITPQEAQERDLSFKFGWKLDRLRKMFHSKFGKAEIRVQTDADGQPVFDRVVYHESPNINAVVWGRTHDGDIHVAVTIQGRPFADNPDGSPADPGIIFGQPCVMGFNLERVAGEDAAVREASEEAGTTAVLGVESMGYHNPNPTFCATWSELYSVQVDLSRITSQTDRSELIYLAEYLPLYEVLSRIGKGEFDGVNYRSATANDAFFVWLTKFPKFLEHAAYWHNFDELVA